MKRASLYVRTWLATTAICLAAQPSLAQISDDVIRIGVMNDQSGPYADNCGAGSVTAAKLAVEDVGGAINGKKIEIVIADDQNKPDVGVATGSEVGRQGRRRRDRRMLGIVHRARCPRRHAR